MTIKIEVTGESIAEVSDKLLAIGGSLRATVSYDADNAAREALQAERNEKPATKTPKSKAAKEAPEKDTGEPQPAPAAEPSAPTAETTASSPAESPASASPAATEPETTAGEPLDYDGFVAPLVMRAVREVGRDPIIALFSEYGVAKAAEIDDARMPEFVARVQDLLEAKGA